MRAAPRSLFQAEAGIRAHWVTGVQTCALPISTPVSVASPLDWHLLAFVITVTTLTGVVFGTAPALRVTSLADVTVARSEERRVGKARQPPRPAHPTDRS